mgnify:CR=1 FL=1
MMSQEEAKSQLLDVAMKWLSENLFDEFSVLELMDTEGSKLNYQAMELLWGLKMGRVNIQKDYCVPLQSKEDETNWLS